MNRAVSWDIIPLPLGVEVPLSAMHRACFPEGPWDAATLERILALAGGFGFLAWRRDSPLGFILARDLAGEVEVLSVGVLPQWRRRGIGRVLFDAVVATAEHHGLGSIVLEVATENTAARALYAAVFSVEIGRAHV